MIPYLSLIKHAVIIAICVGALAYVFNLGQQVERADWEIKEKGRIYAQGVELKNAMQLIADERTANEIYHARVQNEYQDKINELTRDLATSHRLRLSIQKPRCNSDSLPRIADSGKVRDDPASQSGIRDEIAISETLYVASEETLNTGIEQVWQDHQQLKIWAGRLLAKCAPRFDVRG